MSAAKAGDEPAIVSVDGREISISHPEKVFFTGTGQTKLDLVRYYLAIGEPLMRAIGGRPILMERFPDGASGKSFFQKRVPTGTPDWVETTVVSTPNGTTSDAWVAADLAHAVWAVNLGSIGFHPWAYLADDPEHTDELRIDLDPQPGVTFEQVREAASEVKRLFDEFGILSFAKTTGSRGIHVYVRLRRAWDSYQVRSGAVALARELERRRPDLITAAWWKEERGTRVFIDFNQNAPHKTVFGAWAVRPRVGAQVSAPFEWDELEIIEIDALTMTTVPQRVASLGDPWAGMNDSPQDLTPLLDMNAADRASGLMDAPWPPVYPKQPDEPARVAPSRAKKVP